MPNEAEIQRDSHDALAYALTCAVGIPPHMMRPNANGRVYSQRLLADSWRRFMEKMREHKIELVMARSPYDVFPGRFESEHSPGAQQWQRYWGTGRRPVKALEWVAPDIKPAYLWSNEVKGLFGVVGQIVPISTQPLPRHEQTSLSQNRPVCADAGYIPLYCTPDYVEPGAAEPGREPEALPAERPALRDDRRAEDWEDNLGQGDWPKVIDEDLGG